MSEIFLDTETTGLSVAEGDRIVEIACVETQDLIPTKKIFHKILNPEKKKYLKKPSRYTGFLTIF